MPRTAATTVLILVVVASCTAPATAPTRTGSPGPAATPTADSPAPTAPTATPTASPPTASPAAPPTVSPTSGGAISHPTGATDVILRMETGGGLVPMEWVATQAPDFTLYGDGTFIVRPTAGAEPITPGESFEPFMHGRLDEEAVQRLLAFALGPGRLADARAHYPQNTCADCPSTTFTVNAAGIAKTVVVDGLGLAEATDVTDRAAFEQLAELMRSFEQRARDGALGEVVAYDPEPYRVSLLEFHGEPFDEPQPWPWDDISPADFKSEEEFSFRQLVVSRDDVALVTEIPSGGNPGVLAMHDSTLWQLAIRPLLPEESASERER